jgi:hypothetical protein
MLNGGFGTIAIVVVRATRIFMAESGAGDYTAGIRFRTESSISQYRADTMPRCHDDTFRQSALSFPSASSSMNSLERLPSANQSSG